MTARTPWHLTSRSGWPAGVVIDVVKDHEAQRAPPHTSQPRRGSARSALGSAATAAACPAGPMVDTRPPTHERWSLDSLRHINECQDPISASAHAALARARRATMPPCARSEPISMRSVVSCRWRRGRSAVLAMVTTANRDYARVAMQGAPNPWPVSSCDNASSGACEVRAAISRPRSGGSGLYAPPRGHDQGRVCGRWPRGAPVPLARLEG